jgi:hypothetical protein
MSVGARGEDFTVAKGNENREGGEKNEGETFRREHPGEE